MCMCINKGASNSRRHPSSARDMRLYTNIFMLAHCCAFVYMDRCICACVRIFAHERHCVCILCSCSCSWFCSWSIRCVCVSACFCVCDRVIACVSDSGEIGFDLDWNDELAERDDGTEFFIAEVDGQPIGALQIIDPATERTHYWGAVAPNQRAIDIWIGEEAFLGQGYGTEMMTFAINHCFASKDVTAIVIDPLASNTKAHRFYQRFGFVFVERRLFDEDSDCFVFRLDRG